MEGTGAAKALRQGGVLRVEGPARRLLQESWEVVANPFGKAAGTDLGRTCRPLKRTLGIILRWENVVSQAI